jgi:hypothetical protein
VIGRRTFIIGGVTALATQLAAEAQQAARVYRIGVLGNENNPPWDGFRQGLGDLGYVDGRNVSLEWRWSEGKPDRFPALATEIVALRPDVIVVSGTQAARAAKQASSEIPIVMTTSAYPDKIGLVESLSRPGGNITGLSNVGPELSSKKIQLLKEIAPKVARIAVLFNPDSPVEPSPPASPGDQELARRRALRFASPVCTSMFGLNRGARDSRTGRHVHQAGGYKWTSRGQASRHWARRSCAPHTLDSLQPPLLTIRGETASLFKPNVRRFGVFCFKA